MSIRKHQLQVRDTLEMGLQKLCLRGGLRETSSPQNTAAVQGFIERFISWIPLAIRLS